MGQGIITPLAQAAASASATIAWNSWVTISVAVTFCAAGLFLFLAGWLFLPNMAPEKPAWIRSQYTSGFLRVIGGAAIALAAMILAAFALDQGASLSTILTLLFATPWRALARFLVAAIVATGRVLYNDPVRALGAFELGFHWLVTRFPGLAVRSLRAALTDSRFGVVNAIALGLAAAIGGFAGWMSTSSRWKFSGVITWLGLDLLALGLFVFSALLIEGSRGGLAQALGVWLLGVEIFGMFLFLVYQFYTLEYITGRPKEEPSGGFPGDAASSGVLPVVAVQVASYNEPTSIVKECIESILRLDYPKDRLVIQLADDSTDPAVVEELRAFCQSQGVPYLHRDNRRGFKGGALNDATRELPPHVELVAIVDSDYIVEPRFLRVAVAPFVDPVVGFVQTPQAYRNAKPGTLARWYALADAFFYRVVQPVRARAQSLIFCGTMGVLRLRALTSVGGWSEDCVTEDAELSMRLLAARWRGVYLQETLGMGLAPAEMSAVRSQHRRWAFGGMQMLRMNRGNLVAHKLTQRQRIDFRMSGVFWVDGIFLLTATATLVTLVIASWFGVTLAIDSLPAVLILASAPLLLMFDGILKLRLALRSTTPVSFREALGVMSFWYAIKLNDLRASLRGWIGARIPFVRTPKTHQRAPGRAAAFRAALDATSIETSIFAGLVGVILYSADRWGLFAKHVPTLPEIFLLVWLSYYASAYAAALIFDYFSRTSLPEEEIRIPVGKETPRSSAPDREGRPTT
jgi:cellulose synthase/poly-beta-1,6-N-acetylglucosamine synthase-like glycosyltransferase